MNAVRELQKQYVDFLTSLLDEGVLNKHFLLVQQLQDASSPDFVNHVMTIYFQDSKKVLSDVEIALNQKNVDYVNVGASLMYSREISSAVGVRRIIDVLDGFSASFDAKNRKEYLQCLDQLRQEYLFVKNILRTLIQLEQQIAAAGGEIPVMT